MSFPVHPSRMGHRTVPAGPNRGRAGYRPCLYWEQARAAPREGLAQARKSRERKSAIGRIGRQIAERGLCDLTQGQFSEHVDLIQWNQRDVPVATDLGIVRQVV